MAKPTFFNVRTAAARPIAVLLYGYEKVGKTRLSGTFPNPVFIVPELERGTSSLKDLDKDIFCTTVRSRFEMLQAAQYVRDNWQEHGWKTVVVDPFTTYGTIVQMENEKAWSGNDKRQMWGEIANDLVEVWKTVQESGLNVVWVCHVDESRSGDVIVGLEPALAGKKAIQYLRQNVDLILYMTKMEHRVPDEEGKPAGRTATVRAVWSRCPPYPVPQEAGGLPFIAGGRFDGQLVAPCYKPDWAVFQKYLAGYVME